MTKFQAIIIQADTTIVAIEVYLIFKIKFYDIFLMFYIISVTI